MAMISEEVEALHGLGVDRWRLFEDYGLPGAANMALDEALLDSVIAGGDPVVRFYTWRPATLSLGVNQAIGEIDRGACEARGFGLVRRITGGRAVLHQHELTYSVIARESDPRVSGGVLESYRKISLALVNGLRAMGADVGLTPYNRELLRAIANERRQRETGEVVESTHGAVCFDAASAYELTASGGRKLVGSAQARRSGVILQHGSILLDIDWDAWLDVFAYASEAGRERARQKLPSRMTSLKLELSREVPPAEAASALRHSFEETLSISLEPGRLAPHEQADATRLARDKYATRLWTTRDETSGR